MASNATPAQISIQVADVTQPLQVYTVTGNEAISENFNFQVVLVCDDAQLDLEAWLQRSVCLHFSDPRSNTSPTATQRYLHGVVYAIEQLNYSVRYCQYKVTITPRLALLRHRVSQRIFQHLSIPAIIREVLNDAGFNSDEYTLHLSAHYEPRDYCVQYNESDLQFLQRIMAESGLHYHFHHSATAHQLIIADSQDGFPALPALPYVTDNGLHKASASISQLQLTLENRTGQITLRDYDFNKPELRPQGHHSTDISKELGLAEYYYPSHTKTHANADKQAQLALEQRRSQRTQFSALSDSPQLQSGYFQPLCQHPHDDWNQDWLVTHVQHQAVQPQALGELAAGTNASYEARITGIPWHVPFRAPQHPKPPAYGRQTAIVTGPPGETIHCDEHGRIKVQFHWDANGDGSDKTSCWLRVAQGWAGNGYGQFVLPRVGHEVIVSFIHGDINQPIVTGAVYNGQNRPPVDLPADKTRSSFKTASALDATNFNELRVEDKLASEHIYLHAGKDLNIQIANDQTETIHQHDHLSVTGSRYTQRKQDSHDTVQGSQFCQIDQDGHQRIDGSLQQKIGDKQLTQSGAEVHIKVGQKAVINAGNSISVSAGGSLVNVDGSGVSIVGAGVNLGSGNAGQGTPANAKQAKLPLTVEVEQAGELTTPPALSNHTLEALSHNDLAFAALCEKQADGSCPRTDCPCANAAQGGA